MWQSLQRCGGRAVTIVGDDGPDKLKGTKRADVIAAFAGKDTILGRGGNDRICAGKGKDKIVGGGGRRGPLQGRPGQGPRRQGLRAREALAQRCRSGPDGTCPACITAR